jgi:hypothetical protein
MEVPMDLQLVTTVLELLGKGAVAVWKVRALLLPAPADPLKMSFVGLWEGQRVQRVGSENRGDLRLIISLARGRLLCVGSYRHRTLLCTETSLRDRHLTLGYENENPGVRQFGSFNLELSPNSQQLRGVYSGYGPESESLVAGEFLLERVGASVLPMLAPTLRFA